MLIENNVVLKELFPEELIKRCIPELCDEIRKFYNKNESIIVISILNGSVYFTTDLLRELSRFYPLNIETDFIQLSSYEDKFESSGNIKFLKGFSIDLTGKNVLIVDDICETGNTLYYLQNQINTLFRVKSLKKCVCIEKKSPKRNSNVYIDYSLFRLDNPNLFLVGYGMDYKNKFRELPSIYYLEK